MFSLAVRQFHRHRALDLRVSLLVRVRLGYPVIRTYSGRGSFSFSKRKIIPDILGILMCLLSVTRKSQVIFFLSLINFSNAENLRLTEVTRFFKLASAKCPLCSTRSPSFSRQPQPFHLNMTPSLFSVKTITSLF